MEKAASGLKFTVVTVVYNAENAIAKTIESVLNQSYTPYEYLIIDGCSQDKTLEIANGYKHLFEKKGVRYRIISEKDTGIFNAMNKGIDHAEGDFISYLNAGDWYEPNALRDINDFYSEKPFDLVYGGIHYIRPDGSIIDKMSKHDKFISSRHWNHPSMFLRTELYRKYHFDESLPMMADFDLYLKLRQSKARIRIINKIITNFNTDGVSTDTSIKSVMTRAKEKYEAYRKNGFGRIYWIESYGWFFAKAAYLRAHG